MRALQSKEFRTDHRVVEWRIKRKAERWMERSNQVLLVVGNMPDTLTAKRRRYVDNLENWEAQRTAIDNKMREWLDGRVDGEVTVALCSGSRGVDLEAYNSILEIRKERPGLSINVVSILPVNKESFRQTSVLGSIQEQYWNNLYTQLLADPNAVVHEPRFRPYKPWEYVGLGKRKITEEAAVERSIIINGNDNKYRVYSDTQQELIRLTERAYRKDPHIKKSLHMLLVTNGGQANDDGGTNELVARFYRVFGEDIRTRRNSRYRNLRLTYEGHEQVASAFETIAIIQDGMDLADGRELVAPLEDEYLGKNGEYIRTVTDAYRDKFKRETYDNGRSRRETMRRRRHERRHALPQN